MFYVLAQVSKFNYIIELYDYIFRNICENVDTKTFKFISVEKNQNFVKTSKAFGFKHKLVLPSNCFFIEYGGNLGPNGST